MVKFNLCYRIALSLTWPSCLLSHQSHKERICISMAGEWYEQRTYDMRDRTTDWDRVRAADVSSASRNCHSFWLNGSERIAALPTLSLSFVTRLLALDELQITVTASSRNADGTELSVSIAPHSSSAIAARTLRSYCEHLQSMECIKRKRWH